MGGEIRYTLGVMPDFGFSLGADGQDRLFREPYACSSFQFDSRTAQVFDDMLVRSVPMYAAVQDAVASIVCRLARSGTAVVDLGCSTGTTLSRVASRLSVTDVELVGVDRSEPMLEKARTRLADCGRDVRLLQQDLNACAALPVASVVIMNLTLQFVRPERREAVIRLIYESLCPGGALILVEKVTPDCSELHSLFTDIYYDFKRENGYSELEIARKREALENVLVPYTPGENRTLLRQAGFDRMESFFRWFNFEGMVAVR